MTTTRPRNVRPCGCPIGPGSCVHEQQEAARAAGDIRAQQEIAYRRAEANLAQGLCANGYARRQRDARGVLLCPECAWIESEGLDR